jgi:DNA polymerase-1
MGDETALDEALAWLRHHAIGRGDDLAVAVHPDAGAGLACRTGRHTARCQDPAALIGSIETEIGPRWLWWDRTTADQLAGHGVRIARCWDVLTVHRLLHGGWRTSIARVWAWLHDLPIDSLPTMGQLDLLGHQGDEGDDPDDPVRPDGHLRPEWLSGGWVASTERLAWWAALALDAVDLQRALLARRPMPERALSTAHSESAAEFLCAELSLEGLPIDDDEVHRIIAESVGPRPTDERQADEMRRERDAEVVRHLGLGPGVDLRNPADVKAMLRRVAVDVPDTRAWRLEQHRDTHPVVEALLTWRKAERIATTYGYRWLDEHVHEGRLRGDWTSSDGAAGRMTASAGLHNLPAEMRPAVAAEPGHVLVRADLGQIEPRVLAAVSGDQALIAATLDDDLYQPIAARLRVERAVAKVAVLGAMYGSTTGESANALRGLERNYPVAMGYLERAAADGRAGNDVFTVGGRRVRMWVDDSIDGDIDKARRVAAARGRFARNATIQGAAAEFFKVWAIIVRAGAAELGARIVLCLHDELIVHAPAEHADRTSVLLHEAVDEAAYRWSPSRDVRFIADVGVIQRWSEAKA